MDLTKFGILALACTGGFMISSYSYLAKEKGWKLHHLFEREKMTLIILLGLLCQYGSILLAFIIMKWWVAPILGLTGFLSYMILTSFLKSYSQIFSIIIIIGSIILLPKYVFKSNGGNENLKHFKTSINLKNESTQMNNRLGDASITMDDELLQEIIDKNEQALEEAKKVDIGFLNNRLNGFGDHYKNEFIDGLELMVSGFKNDDQEMFIKGQVLLDNWGEWYSNNMEKIKNSN